MNKELEIESRKISLTLSIGIASIDEHQNLITLDIFARRADQALYQSKRGGKNRVTVWQPNQQ